MCVTFGPAKLSETILFAADGLHNGELVHYLGYQNTFENRQDDINAMVIPFPTEQEIGPNDTLDASDKQSSSFMTHLRDMTGARPQERLLSRSIGRGASFVQTFTVGGYTVVTSKDAHAIVDALDELPKGKQPLRVPSALIRSYGDLYPGWPVAVCLFDGSKRSHPIVFRYRPAQPDRLFFPGTDAHDGQPPTDERVGTDHALVYGLGAETAALSGVGTEGLRRELPEHIAAIVPPTAYGFGSRDLLRNGDWIVKKDDLFQWGQNAAPKRVAPPGRFWLANVPHLFFKLKKRCDNRAGGP